MKGLLSYFFGQKNAWASVTAWGAFTIVLGETFVEMACGAGLLPQFCAVVAPQMPYVGTAIGLLGIRAAVERMRGHIRVKK